MHTDAAQQKLPPLIRSLCRAEAWPHPADDVRVIETHVSWILLAGDFAYKIKRPVDLGFLDFSTLEQRREACTNEFELNRAFAPDLYLGVVAIVGSADSPEIAEADSGGALEYAVRMRRFRQGEQLDRLLAAGELRLDDMDDIARTVATMHGEAAAASTDGEWGGFDSVVNPAMENFNALEPLVDDAGDRNTLKGLQEWTTVQSAMLAERIEARRAAGHVRETHGDLHLSNLARLDGRITAFDCIEFDPALRWRDTMSDIGFLVMDLAARQRVDMAWRFLNRYLEITGDYNGAALLRYYIVYASMVRAKVAAIRAEQNDPASQVFADSARHYRMHLALAERAARPRHPAIVLTTGLSGSGKTWLTNRLCCVMPAVRVRSDLERRRVHGIALDEKTTSEVGAGIYSPEGTTRTYGRLRDLARDLLAARLDVIVDAAFLEESQRHQFLDLARDTGAALIILECHADPKVLRERVTQRAWDGADASEADTTVLAHQQQSYEELTAGERALSISVDTTGESDPLRVAGAIWRKLGRETTD